MDLSPSQFVDEFSNFIESQRAKGLAIYTSFSQDVPPVVVAANSTPNTSVAHTTTVAGKHLPGIYLHLAQPIVYYEYTIMHVPQGTHLVTIPKYEWLTGTPTFVHTACVGRALCSNQQIS